MELDILYSQLSTFIDHYIFPSNHMQLSLLEFPLLISLWNYFSNVEERGMSDINRWAYDQKKYSP